MDHASEGSTDDDQGANEGEDGQANGDNDEDGDDQDNDGGGPLAQYDDPPIPTDLGGGHTWNGATNQEQSGAQASNHFVLPLHGGPPSAPTPASVHNLDNYQQDALSQIQGTQGAAQNDEQTSAGQGGMDDPLTLAVAASDSDPASPENMVSQSNQGTQNVGGIAEDASGQDDDTENNNPSSSRAGRGHRPRHS